MSRRYGPPLLFLGILMWLLLPHTPCNAAQTHTTDAEQSDALLTCSASPGMVRPGKIVTLTAGEPKDSTGLVYSFSSSGGKLQHDGRTARLDTAGVPAGTAILVTCDVVDGEGRRSTGKVTVYVVDARTADYQRLTEMSHSSQAASAKNRLAEMAAADDAIRGVDSSPEAGVEKDMSRTEAARQATMQAGASSSKENQAATNAHSSKQHRALMGGSAGALVGGLGGVGGSAGALAGAAVSPVKNTDAYQQAEQVLQWKNELKNGKIDYLIPPLMKLHEETVVKVVVHGYADTSQNNMAGATTGTLKVSPRMQMQLTAEDNPDEFEIDPKVGAIQFVPIDGSTTWMWNVTPKQPAKDQKLTIRALLVYPDNGQQIEQEITSYVATVNVSVPGFWQSLREDFWNDPSAAIKYVLPGGTGFTALAALIVWWWKRRHPAENKAEKDEE